MYVEYHRLAVGIDSEVCKSGRQVVCDADSGHALLTLTAALWGGEIVTDASQQIPTSEPRIPARRIPNEKFHNASLEEPWTVLLSQQR